MMGNDTQPVEFILMGFSMSRVLQKVLFAPCLALYLLMLAGNATVVSMICFDSRLHTPMYFFLCNFSVAEMLVTSTVVPRMLVGLGAERDTIPFGECLAQFYFYFSLGTTVFLLMAVMSIDRYVAICHPLHYSTILTNDVCLQSAFAVWATSFFSMIPPAAIRAGMSFCRSNEIDHFFCDNAPLLKLSCSDTRLIELWDFLLAALFILSSFTMTVASYGAIIFTILRIPSATGRQKAFSTCASHFTVVIIGYGTTIFIYVRPNKSYSTDLNKMVALLTSIVTPFLNPFIFTLRNEKVKEVFRDWLGHLRSL
ncbi:olfactory receptor 6V1 [Heteronotia binoei]|uniref:olfactory receptor 6V1 n=1 Tax=Heteronotia binoei TaxID=13085 RepID=UPI00292E45E6|nr:olfactory receptor 6V1 [Heteronotia binoei]XP_060092338.1 olfactory receptor 6V1 [Heteronotia binoei]XP_060092339.1 olfactory receptor 6V1 [Heteronotia binoei]